jgi:hypothetical protein
MPYFDDVVLTIKAESDVAPDAPDFSCDATGATLKPDTTVTQRNYLCGSKTIVAEAVWTLTLDLEQNWDAVEGLSQYLFDHAGEKAQVTINSSTLEKSAACTTTLVPSQFGGTAGEIAEATIDLGVDGQPTFADYTPPAALEAGAEAEAVEVDA